MSDPATMTTVQGQDNAAQQTEIALKTHIQALEAKLADTEGKNHFLQATLDALAPSTVVLAPDGKILHSNAAWLRFSQANSGLSPAAYQGEDYLTICERMMGMSATDKSLAAAGIRTVIAGQQAEFRLELLCHTGPARRWFLVLVTPLTETSPCRVVVTHLDITAHKQAEEAERVQRCFAEALRDSLAALTTSLDVERVMGQILTAAATVVPSEAGSIILFEEEQGRLAYFRGFTPEAEAFLRQYRFPRESVTLTGSLAHTQPYLVPDTQSCASWIPLPFTEWIRSSIGVPIEIRGEIIGLLVADSAVPYHLQPQDVEKLQAFARYASLALENAYHVSRLEQRVVERTTALAEERNLLRTLIDAMPDVIYVKDTDHRFVLRNHAQGLLLPTVMPEDIIGKTDADFFPLPQAEAIYAEEQVILRTGQPLLHHELLAARNDGSRIWISLTKVPLRNLQGEIIGLAGILHDISQRKQDEQQLRFYASLQENVSDAVITTDLDFRIQSWNRAAEMIYGWGADEVIGKSVTEILHTAYASAAERQQARQALLQQGYGSGEVLQYRKDGAPLYVLYSVTLLKDQQGVPYGIVAVNHDITRHKQAEAALQQALQTEKELSELKSRFLAMASHEFRTPLTTILMLAETLRTYRHRLTEEQMTQRLNNMLAQVSHLKAIMDDVLQLAQLQARRDEFNPIMLDLDALCRTIVAELQNQPAVTARLHYSCAGAIPLINADQRLMRQIISNLVTNALKYSAPEKIVHVTLTHGAAALLLQVQDEGIGIPAADLPPLFQPFHRASNVSSFSGTGLGLAITKAAVERHGGAITVESQMGVGTIFTVSLPLCARRTPVP